jgi:hypothetical protein
MKLREQMSAGGGSPELVAGLDQILDDLLPTAISGPGATPTSTDGSAEEQDELRIG